MERVNVFSFGHSNLTFRHSLQVTVRYSRFANAADFHGIDSKDCGPDDPNVSDLVGVSGDRRTDRVDRGRLQPPTTPSTPTTPKATTDRASTSTPARASSPGTARARTPTRPSSRTRGRVLIHDNEFAGGEGVKFYSTRSISGHVVGRIVLHRNRFRIDDGSHSFRNATESRDLYAIDNVYEPGDPQKISNPGRLYACAGTQETRDRQLRLQRPVVGPVILLRRQWIPRALRIHVELAPTTAIAAA